MPKDGDASLIETSKNPDAEFTTKIQDEIKELHAQLQKKDHIINQLKFLIAR